MNLRSLVLLAGSALILAACGGKPNVPAPGTPSAQPGPAAPAPSPAPEPAVPPAGASFQPDGPVSPLGEEIQIGPLRVAILSVVPDAWPELQGSSSVTAPAPDHQYVVARVRAVNATADETLQMMNLSMGYTDRDANFYSLGLKLLEEPCWNVPDSVYDHPELAPGATAEFNACLEVPSAAVPGGVFEFSWMAPDEMEVGWFMGVQ